MQINLKNLVSMTEANQNFSKVAKLVDENGAAVILKNNTPRYVVLDYNKLQGEENTIDTKIAANVVKSEDVDQAESAENVAKSEDVDQAENPDNIVKAEDAKNSENTDNQMVEEVAKRILGKHIKAFEELAK